LAALALLAASCAGAWAHDVPADVRLYAFVKPAGERLELLVRVPMIALQEVGFPRRGPGYLEVSRAGQALRDAAQLWLVQNIDVFENGTALAAPTIAQARVSLPSDRSFGSYERARAHLDAPLLADKLDLPWDQQLLDVLLAYPIRSERSDFAIEPRLDRMAHRVSVSLRFLPPGGATRAFELTGAPGLVPLDPRWHQAALRFGVSGFWHILEGIDHLLFLLCLIVPVRRLGPLVVIVTAFTVAHSISLIASALNFVPDAAWFPPLVETLVAVTIVYMALENILARSLERRWMIAFAFGIVHGFGFSFALRESLQFAGDHLLTSLLAFNLGVEAGQLAVLLVLVPALALWFRYGVQERLGVIVVSALVAHTGWHWMLERGAELMKVPFPRVDAAFLASLMRGTIAVLVLAGGVLVANALIRRFLRSDDLARRGAAGQEPADELR
jgi:hypothetical protein